MKTRTLFAAIGLALVAPSPALAAGDHSESPSDRYEWRQAPQVGPRASGPSLKWVRVTAASQMASCDCDMMRTGADDCRRSMRSSAAPSHG